MDKPVMPELTQVRIVRAVYDALVVHAREAVPEECCGLLLSTGDLIDASVPARNLLRSATRFRIDPADHFGAIRLARASGRAVMGAYHSHPLGPSTPSPTDTAEMNDPSLLHVIVSLASGSAAVGAYAWRGGNFVGIDLVPVP